ncbi:MAG: M67 family metallopeptidase [Synechococcales cyanobacterium]
MVLTLTAAHLHSIRLHGEQAFPQECCGLLLGSLQRREGTDYKDIQELWPVTNTWGDPENPLADGESINRRFLIDPADFKRGHDYAYQKGLGVVGTYHSHPNHPAIPSEFDRQHAFPWGFSCIIVSIQAGQAQEIISWVLDDQDQPQQEPLVIT